MLNPTKCLKSMVAIFGLSKKVKAHYACIFEVSKCLVLLVLRMIGEYFAHNFKLVEVFLVQDDQSQGLGWIPRINGKYIEHLIVLVKDFLVPED